MPLLASAQARPTGRRGRVVSRWLTGFSIGIAIGILAVGAYLLLQTRANAWGRAERASNNLTLALERDIARNIRLIDLSLQGVIEAMAEPGFAQASPEVRQRALFARAAGAEELGSVLVLDRYGTVVQDSTSARPHTLNLADRDYFRIHMDQPDAGLYVSRAYRSRLRASDLSIAVSRRLPDRDNEFQGVVMGALRLNYLHRLFADLDIGSNGSITLVRTDGRLLARYPYDAAEFDLDLSSSTIFARFLSAKAGSFSARSVLDGTHRFYTFRQIAGLPLVIAVNISVDDVLDAWLQRFLLLGSLLAALAGAALVLCFLLRREMIRREAAERALTESADELARLASTDALTGLTNRRGFETEMHWEWKRAQRADAPIALLIIDADHFKSYNDRHGHPAGDAVLRMLATAIAGSVRRPGDCAARYGGEEFAALLPDTELGAALVVAENIRASVRELAIPHHESASGCVTVSIGVSAAWPHQGSTEACLVQCADTALYAAKRAGRDRVGAEPLELPDAAEQSSLPIRSAAVVLG